MPPADKSAHRWENSAHPLRFNCQNSLRRPGGNRRLDYRDISSSSDGVDAAHVCGDVGVISAELMLSGWTWGGALNRWGQHVDV